MTSKLTSPAMKRASANYKTRIEGEGIKRKSLWIKPVDHALIDKIATERSNNTGSKKPSCMADIISEALAMYLKSQA
jgi:hypothetical protein